MRLIAKTADNYVGAPRLVLARKGPKGRCVVCQVFCASVRPAGRRRSRGRRLSGYTRRRRRGRRRRCPIKSKPPPPVRFGAHKHHEPGGNGLAGLVAGRKKPDPPSFAAAGATLWRQENARGVHLKKEFAIGAASLVHESGAIILLFDGQNAGDGGL